MWRKVSVTKEHIVQAEIDDRVNGLPLIESCAVHHALRPFISEKFFVGSSIAYTAAPSVKRFVFKDILPDLLYGGMWTKALEKVKKDGPYEIEVDL